MNDNIAKQIQAEQDHGRQKYGGHKDNLAHDSRNSDSCWSGCIADHNARALHAPGKIERRQHLIKVAGLAISAVEAIDRTQTVANMATAAEGLELLVTIVVNGIPSDECHPGKSILRNITNSAIKKRGYETGDQWEVKDAGGHLLAEDCELCDVWQQIVYASKAYCRGSRTLLFVALKAGVGA